jgi:ribulose-phosphate 3-epimerase
MAELSPSVISADFGHLADELARVEPYSASWHVDVMDGHYVPNLTIGPLVVEAISRCSDLPQDVHLMIVNVEETWEWYAKAGARRIAFHPEVSEHPARLMESMAAAGVSPGLAINPDVEIRDVEKHLGQCEHVVVMSVFPGFSGQAFIPGALDKLQELRKWVDDRGDGPKLFVDGGVSPSTASGCVSAGADYLVSASAVFGAADSAAVARELAHLADGGHRRD